MNNLYLFSVAFKYYFKRVTRDPFGILIYTVVPVILIAVIGAINSQNVQEEIFVNGYNMVMTYVGISMLLLFLLNGGILLLNYLDIDFGKAMKWRLKTTPCPTHIMVFAATIVCSIFIFIQGVLVISVTGIFMDAYWGNLMVTLGVVLLISVFSMLLNIILFFTVKKLSLAETLSWVITWMMAALGGMMFSLPENSFFELMRNYGTPFALGQRSILASGFIESSHTDVWIGILGLVGINILFSMIVMILGRRKLA
ncbi:hypothetical protein EDC19_1912 [Natranaerovirga hydrolytica]|uniref:ABC-2 type transport system permease protein n=1 Tax=Natranaerovirga hydrolytica TaxID=680378 RepID=A0A4R1MJS0_9FIRM|nr:hypothetical protein [Natranaerovirga hydrolytica]TCK92757.1 hypothetical protein EDC19_1912 [Natranaerovirga hydrolytica]